MFPFYPIYIGPSKTDSRNPLSWHPALLHQSSARKNFEDTFISSYLTLVNMAIAAVSAFVKDAM